MKNKDLLAIGIVAALGLWLWTKGKASGGGGVGGAGGGGGGGGVGGAGGGGGVMASWIPTSPNIKSEDYMALLTYPEITPFGRSILVIDIVGSQGQTFISPSALLAFITLGGQWAVLPYPYLS